MGAILAIRTGPADFSHWLMTPRSKGGGMPAYLREKNGALWRIEESGSPTMIATSEESDFFAALGIHWIEPQYRERPPRLEEVLR